LSKVPAVTLGFWVIKILATTLGETGGDTVTMSLGWGYLAGGTLFGGVLVALVVTQIFAMRFHATLYWATIVTPTTFGTTLADFLLTDRSGSATRVDRFCFLVVFWPPWGCGIGRRERYR
jgi:uncharacterized membrane-anchored protein